MRAAEVDFAGRVGVNGVLGGIEPALDEVGVVGAAKLRGMAAMLFGLALGFEDEAGVVAAVGDESGLDCVA